MSSVLPPGFLPDGHLPTGHIPEVADGSTPAASVDVRQRFAVTFPFYQPGETNFYALPPAVKDPEDELKVELDFFLWCANFFRSNEPTVANEHLYPTRATGLIYKSGGGVLGFREPAYWPRTIGQSVVSGAATLEAVADGGEALVQIVSPTAAADPAGDLTITDVSVSDYRKILATYVGGTVDQDFVAVYSFMLNGAQRRARQLVMVRKR